MQISLVLFCVLADCTLLGTSETTQQKLKYDTFEGGLFTMPKTEEILVKFFRHSDHAFYSRTF